MRILISGAGRSGTNLVTEVASGLSVVRFTKQIEDRKLFDYDVLPENYGTKLTTENKGFTLENIIKLMEGHHDLRIIFSIRHPVDTCMSKIIRGHVGNKAPDRTVEGSIAAVRYFYMIYRTMLALFAERIYGAKMEDLILNPKGEVGAIAFFLNTEVTKTALEFYKHNRNKFHLKRYKRRIDRSQVGICERWAEAYDGFFSQREGDINILKEELRPIAEELGYGVPA